MIIAKANLKENLGEFIRLSITKANVKTNLQIFFVIIFVWMVNREVKTVNWEAGKEGAVETGVKRGLRKAHKPWIEGKNSAQTVN